MGNFVAADAPSCKPESAEAFGNQLYRAGAIAPVVAMEHAVASMNSVENADRVVEASLLRTSCAGEM